MYFLLLILSLGFLSNDALGGESASDYIKLYKIGDPISKVDLMLADNSIDPKTKFSPNYSPDLFSVLTDTPIRETPATERETLLMIEAWDYIAKSISQKDKENCDKQLQDKISRTDKASHEYAPLFTSLVVLDYLYDRTKHPGKQTKIPAIEDMLGKIAQDQNARTFKIMDIQDDEETYERLQGYETYDKRNYDIVDRGRTDRLVTFDFDDNEDIIGCNNSNLYTDRLHWYQRNTKLTTDYIKNKLKEDRIKQGPFVIYQRSLPTVHGGITDYTKIMESSNKGYFLSWHQVPIPRAFDYLRINNDPKFLYLTLIGDGERDIVYGVPNPNSSNWGKKKVQNMYGEDEKPGKLVQLSRGTPSKKTLARVTSVENFLTHNDYLLLPLQLMQNGDRDSFGLYMKKLLGTDTAPETEPKVFLKDSIFPHMLFGLTRNNVVVEALDKYRASEPIKIMVKEVTYGTRLSPSDDVVGETQEVEVQLSHFRDPATLTQYKKIQDKQTANPPKLFLIKYTRHDVDPPEWVHLKYLYAKQVLYRWVGNATTGSLVQESVGFPQPSIYQRKETLEKAIGADPKLLEDGPWTNSRG